MLRLPGTRVLLVEDGASNRKLITLVLQRAGAVVEWAEDGKTGSDMALAGKYDVVLMDMQMPIMDGYTAARRCRKEGLKTPIIALTAHAMRGDEEKCREAGCTGFLTKPIDMDLLVRTIGQATGNGAIEEKSPARIAPVPALPSPQSGKEPADATASIPAVLTSSLPSNDPEFCQIIVEFVDRLHDQLGAMQQAWEKQDLSELATLAHWLKGSGGTAGFAALTDPARKLEQLAREKKLEEIGGAIDALNELAEHIVVPPVEVDSSTANASSSIYAVGRAGTDGCHERECADPLAVPTLTDAATNQGVWRNDVQQCAESDDDLRVRCIGYYGSGRSTHHRENRDRG